MLSQCDRGFFDRVLSPSEARCLLLKVHGSGRERVRAVRRHLRSGEPVVRALGGGAVGPRVRGRRTVRPHERGGRDVAVPDDLVAHASAHAGPHVRAGHVVQPEVRAERGEPPAVHGVDDRPRADLHLQGVTHLDRPREREGEGVGVARTGHLLLGLPLDGDGRDTSGHREHPTDKTILGGVHDDAVTQEARAPRGLVPAPVPLGRRAVGVAATEEHLHLLEGDGASRGAHRVLHLVRARPEREGRGREELEDRLSQRELGVGRGVRHGGIDRGVCDERVRGSLRRGVLPAVGVGGLGRVLIRIVQDVLGDRRRIPRRDVRLCAVGHRRLGHVDVGTGDGAGVDARRVGRRGCVRLGRGAAHRAGGGRAASGEDREGESEAGGAVVHGGILLFL